MSLPPIDKNWERWIVGSIFKFLDDQNKLLAKPYALYREGEQRKTNSLDAFLEMRIDGPKYAMTPSYYRVQVELNVLIQLQVDKDLYHVNKMSSDVALMINNPIQVIKIGNDPGDDQSLVACLRVDNEVGIVAHKYGIVEPKLPTMQATVGTKYWVDLPA